ncbi:MAG: EAL domain-containing protein [Burkholderiaceae bacterium]
MFAASRFIDMYAPDSSAIEVPYLSGGAQAGVTAPRMIQNSLSGHDQSILHSLDRPLDTPLWVWLKVSESAVAVAKPVIFDLRMLRAEQYSFWLMPQDTTLAPREISRSVVSGEGGLYIVLPAVGFAYDLVGEIHSPYGWKPSINAWHGLSLENLQKGFTKTGASLYVVFLALAMVSLCIAVVNRSQVFIVFAGWLIASIMITGFNYGWDFSWLGVPFTGAGLSIGLMTTVLSAYGFLSGFLFLSIFGQHLKDSWIAFALQLCITGFFVTAIVGAFAPLSVFMTLIWSNGLFGIACIALGLIKVIGRGARLTAWLYACSYVFLISGVTAEIFYQIGFLPGLRDVISAAGSSIASAIVMTVTLAVQFRDERSARQIAQQGEMNALKRLEGVYNRSPVGLFSLDEHGALISSNTAFRRFIDPEGKRQDLPSFDDFWHAGLDKICANMTRRFMGHSEEVCLTHDDGESQWFAVRLSAGTEGFDGSITDISWRKQAEQKLSYLATNDPVTGALNQHGLNSALKERINKKRAGVFGQIAFDHFAYILRIQGFDIGDKLLAILVREIQQALPNALTARVSDSVYLLVDDISPDEVKAALETRFSALVKTGVVIGEIVLPSSFSAGICRLDGCEKITEAFTRAKLAFEIAVEQQHKCAVITDDQSVQAIRQLDDIRASPTQRDQPDMGRFFLLAQPVINLQSLNSPLSFELLLRMRDDNGEAVLPSQFLPAAEKVGLMSTLDRFVFNQVIRLVESGDLPIYRLEHVSINLSGSSLNDPAFLKSFYQQVANSKVDAAHFCFEVTESVALNSYDQTKGFLTALRALGAHTAIDDFGAGHSSVHYLSELSPDYLKLDGSLVKDMLENSVHQSYLEKMVALAHEMGVKCIAEYVDSQDCHNALIEMGVRYGQGNLYSPPIEIADAADFCKRWQTMHSSLPTAHGELSAQNLN